MLIQNGHGHLIISQKTCDQVTYVINTIKNKIGNETDSSVNSSNLASNFLQYFSLSALMMSEKDDEIKRLNRKLSLFDDFHFCSMQWQEKKSCVYVVDDIVLDISGICVIIRWVFLQGYVFRLGKRISERGEGIITKEKIRIKIKV